MQFGHCMLVTELRWTISSHTETLENNNGVGTNGDCSPIRIL